MTEQFAALAAVAQNPGKIRDEVLADFYSKWSHDFLLYSLNGGFCGSPVNFHVKDGSGYKFLGELVELDKLNPQIASHMVLAFSRWRRYDETRQILAKVYSLIADFCGSPEFSSDMGSRTVKQIADVSRLRNYQFLQDAGPMAHPVRPHSYIKVYEKSRGATYTRPASERTHAVSVGLPDSNGKDVPLTSLCQDGTLQSIARNEVQNTIPNFNFSPSPMPQQVQNDITS
ncbi:Peptidase M1, alanyl aminopeptidase, C-terminal [Dillenia turbinata]|uniref:Peptidase M1, alanyl aminopeptidase, C-terminal n=1 Tax=Dillenia turbinata TaxID=194707 RepID=A0AAN8WJP7_9MAGN